MTNGEVDRFNLSSNPTGELAVFIRGGSHQCDLSVVNMQIPITELLGNRVDAAEVYHVQRTETQNQRHACLDECVEPIRTGWKDAANDFVRDFGRRDVKHAANQSGPDKMFHCPPTSSRGVKDETVVSLLFKFFANGMSRRVWSRRTLSCRDSGAIPKARRGEKPSRPLREPHWRGSAETQRSGPQCRPPSTSS